MISVNDLISNNSHSLTSQHIFGRLHIVNDASRTYLKEYQRGTILLFDIYKTDIKINCQVDRMYHDLQDTMIIIPQWTLVTLKDHIYLEFSIETIKRLSNPYATIKEEKDTSVKNLLKLLKYQQQSSSSLSPYFCFIPRQLTLLKTSSLNQLDLNLLGYLSAKSILYDKPGSDIVFFIELMDINNLSSTTTAVDFSNSIYSIPISFKGDHLIKYYYELEVGRYYIFNHLMSSIVTSSTSSYSFKRKFKRHILQYNLYNSSFIKLSKKQYNSFYFSYLTPTNDILNESPSPSPSPSYQLKTDLFSSTDRLQLTLHNLDDIHLIKYKGIITRVIDPLFGIYELDNETLLCLFHYLGYSEKLPYHVGTRLIIHQVHMITLEAKTNYSLLLDKLWRMPFVKRNHNKPLRIALVACMRSNIRIEITNIDNNNDNDNGIDKMKNNNNTSTIINMDSSYNMLFNNDNDNNTNSNSFNHLIYKRLIYWNCINYCQDFVSLLKHLELYASLVFKFFFLFEQKNGINHQQNHSLLYIGKSIIEFFFPHHSDHQQQQYLYTHGDIYGDFFQHHQTCLAINSTILKNEDSNDDDNNSVELLTLRLSNFPTLQHTINSILDESTDNGFSYKLKNIVSLNRLSLHLATSSVNVNRYVYDTTAALKTTAMNNLPWVIGVIDVLPDGRLYFKDDSYKILLIINNKYDNDDNDDNDDKNEIMTNLQLGHMYTINHFHLVVEDLSYLKPTYINNKVEDNEFKLEYQYMMCDWKDIQHITSMNITTIEKSQQKKKNIKEILSIPYLDDDTRLRLCHFTVMNENFIKNEIALYYIIDIMPTSTRYDHKGTLHLEKWVQAIRYLIVDANDRNLEMDSEIVTLVFTSQFNSLSYTHSLKINTWFGFSHIHQSDPFLILPEDHPKLRKIRFHQHLTYFINNDQFQLYSVILQKEDHLHHDFSSLAISLNPVFKSKHNIPLSSLTSSIISPSTDHWKKRIPILTISRFITTPDELIQREKSNKNQFINVRGIVLFKAFINNNNINYHNDNFSCKLKKDAQLFQKLNIGFGKSGRQLFIRLKQMDGLHTLDIYMENEDFQTIHTAGVIPGNTITIYKVEKRQSTQNKTIYGRIGPYSYIQVEPQLNETILENTVTTFTDNISITSLITLHSSSSIATTTNNKETSTSSDDDIFKIIVTVSMILKLQLQWLCRNCGTVISGEKCLNECQHSGFLFRAEAIVVVTDGTSDAHAFIDGEDLIFQLLMLLPSQETKIKLASLKHGTLSFGKYFGDKNNDIFTSMESLFNYQQQQQQNKNIITLEDLCKKIKKDGQYTMYVKRFHYQTKKTRTNESSSIVKELGLRSINVIDQDQTIQTLAFKHMKIKVIALELMDSSEYAWSLLNKI